MIDFSSRYARLLSKIVHRANVKDLEWCLGQLREAGYHKPKIVPVPEGGWQVIAFGRTVSKGVTIGEAVGKALGLMDLAKREDGK